MDSQDQFHANVPARVSPSSSRLPAQVAAVSRELTVAASPTNNVDTRSLLRGLARNWWRILLIWMIVSAPLVFLLYKYVEPTYRAFSLVRVESSQPELFGPTIWSREFSTTQAPTYLQNEIETIKSHRTLHAAIGKLGGAKLSMFRDVEDPELELRKKLEVAIIPNTHFIEVALESKDPREAADIVNAIMGVFTAHTKEVGTASTQELAKNLGTYKNTLFNDIGKIKDQLLKIAQEGHVEYSAPKLPSASKDPENEQVFQPSFETVSMDAYRSAKDRLFQTDIQIIELEAQYKARQGGGQDGSDAQAALSGEVSEQLRAQIADEFIRMPDVAQLIDEMKATKDELDHTRAVARKGADPSRLEAQKQYQKMWDEYNRLWASRSEQIRQRLLVPTSASGVQNFAELKRKIDELKNSKTQLAEMIKSLKNEKNVSHEKAVEATFLNVDLAQQQSRFEMVDRKLEQLKFTKDKGAISVEDTYEAQYPKVPFNNKRWKYMALLPVAVLAAVLGLFLMLELKSERVANPDMLSNRVGSEVFALPPLPSRKNAQKLEGPAVDDQIDRFIQRLDHLRFAVCGDHRDTELGRCLFVTSAVGGEGKTTLAAQLAARCGNAGISTILIDADMRRAALSPLMDVPEGPGLSDLLNEEAKLEDVVVPLQGGAFSLLPAGSPVSDTTSLLQGRGLAMLIAQLRQRYEMIIIDSPPILPVPDALILGRWTDGALLAARFDVSRSPQVERARKQLDNASIPVLGTVINGMHSSDAYYGRYNYGRFRDSQRKTRST